MAIAFDNATSGSNIASASPSFSFTTSGSDRVLLLFLNKWTGGGSPAATYNGVSMSLLGSHASDGTWMVFYLLNPDSGSNTLAISGLPSTRSLWCVASYTGVRQASFPDASDFTDTGTGTSLTTTITTNADNCWVVSGSYFPASVVNEPAAGASTTRRTGTNNGTMFVSASLFDNNSAKTPAGNVTLTGTTASSRTQYFLTVSMEPSASVSNSNFLMLL